LKRKTALKKTTKIVIGVVVVSLAAGAFVIIKKKGSKSNKAAK